MNESVLVAPEKADLFSGCLRALASSPHRDEMLGAQVNDDFWTPPDSWMARFRPYVVTNGVLQIPVKGMLLHDFPWAFGSWATGYIYIQKAFERGMDDSAVRGIALVCDSPGGEAAGNFDCVDKMYARRGEKPVRAFAAEVAYSGAYSIASVAHKLMVTRTGGVGSIGVVTTHVDVSKAVEDAGWKITFVFAGKHKVDGNPFQPLPEDVRARMQARVDGLYSLFVATVARNRRLKEEAVRATEALTFTADEAVSNGLADGIGSLDDAVAAFAADLTSDDSGDTFMTEKKDAAAVDQAAAVDAARKEGVEQGRKDGIEAGRKEGIDAGRAEGIAAERKRIGDIMKCDAAKTRSAAALHVALTTDMTAEQAQALLSNLPEAKGKDAFTEAMDKGEQPNLGAGKENDPNDTQSKVQSILAAQHGSWPTPAKK